MNDDLWRGLLGDLPCLEVSEDCIKKLQETAIGNSATLKAIDERIEVVEQRIAEARKNNQKTIALGVFEPLVQSYLKLDPVTVNGVSTGEKRGFLNKVLDVFVKPIAGINEVLSLIGLPLFRNASGGDPAAQQRAIGIADLEVKLADVKRNRQDIASKLREEINLAVLDWDLKAREFQIAQEIARRESAKVKLIEIGYRLGKGDTSGFLSQLSSLDQRKAETYRTWAKLRGQVARIKLLVLGSGEE